LFNDDFLSPLDVLLRLNIELTIPLHTKYPHFGSMAAIDTTMTAISDRRKYTIIQW